MSVCHYRPRFKLSPKKNRELTVLLLDCWQREYDRRPYKHFRFDRLSMEERLHRNYNPCKDFPIIVQFLQKNILTSAQIVGIKVISNVEEFVAALINVSRVALRLMSLPLSFYVNLERIIEFSHIKFLSFEGSIIEKKDIEILQSILYKSTTLQYLNLSNCSITQFVFPLIADGIFKSPSLKGFNCSHILGGSLSIDTDKFAHTISSLINHNKLQEIVLRFCEFNSQDMKLLAENLTKKNQLQALDVANNLIGPDGAAVLLDAIATGSNLLHLNLRGCNLGRHGGEWVVKHLSSCNNLRYLNISYNFIPAITVNTILTTYKKRLPLKKLFIYGNYFNKETGTILHRLLESGVLLQDSIDIAVTKDDIHSGFRIIPWRPQHSASLF